LRYRTPWDFLTGTFCKGTLIVVGDAMHVVEESFKRFVKERRMRVVRLSLQSYLTVILLEASSWVKKVVCIVLLSVLFSNSNGHSDYDCGDLGWGKS
ncbi:hypothetical protein Tco_0244736, partial [Tanacetum coccineum]